MSVIKWEPFRDIERFLGENSPAGSMSQLGWDLAIDIYEENNNIIAKMTLPDIDPDNVDISIEDDVLRIKGTREDEKETKDKNYYSKEIRRGSFERNVRLPSEVHRDKADAEYKDGILKIIMPRKEEKSRDTQKIRIRR